MIRTCSLMKQDANRQLPKFQGSWWRLLMLLTSRARAVQVLCPLASDPKANRRRRQGLVVPGLAHVERITVAIHRFYQISTRPLRCRAEQSQCT